MGTAVADRLASRGRWHGRKGWLELTLIGAVEQQRSASSPQTASSIIPYHQGETVFAHYVGANISSPTNAKIAFLLVEGLLTSWNAETQGSDAPKLL